MTVAPGEDPLMPAPPGAPGAQPVDPAQYSTPEEAFDLLSKYWAAEKDPKKLWATLTEKEADFYAAYERRGLLSMARMIFGAYFGLSGASSASSRWETQTIQFEGEDGELIAFSVNEIRSFYDQVINMTCKNRPSFQAQAINTDYDSLAQVEASDATVQYYYEQVYGERKEKEAVKREILYGKAYTHIDWDKDGGPDVEIDEDIPSNVGALPAKRKVRSGECTISQHYAWDVICEPYRSEFDDHLWRTIIPPKRSKAEMIARFPLFAKQIQESTPSDNPYEFRFPGADPLMKMPEDMCSLRVFYHAKSAALPNGRKVLFVNDVLVKDEPLPIDEIPIVPLMSCELHGTSFGVSDLWNLLPCEQMQNQVMSDTATNVEAFGRPPLALVEGTDIDLDALANGQKVLFIPPNTPTPEPVKFPQIGDVSFKLVELLRHFKQSLSGLNAISRGDTTANITSGAHAALYSQIAVEAQAPRQAELDLMREKIGNILLQYLKKFAMHPQLVAVAGQDERSYMKKFTSDDLTGIHRVVVKTANPAMRTQAGRMQVAEVLRDWPGQPLKDPARIIELITSGQFKPSYSIERTIELNIRRENEALLKAPPTQVVPGPPDPMTGLPSQKKTVPTVPVYATDNAAKHLAGHLEVLYSPAAQGNPAVLDATLTHILEHVAVAREGDPYLAQLLNNPPPQQAEPAPGQQQQPGASDQGKGANGSGPTQGTQQASAKVLGDQQDDSSQGARVPKPAEPAEPAEAAQA